MTKIAMILGSTRPNRVGGQVADWALAQAANRRDASFTLIDLRDYPLPHLDEPLSPMLGNYQQAHTLRWARAIASFDGYVFITPEYNHGTSGVLKNAIDYLFAEWANKPAGLISYGIFGGTGAAAQLRQMCGQLGMADVAKQVPLSLTAHFERYTVFQPTPFLAGMLEDMLDQVVAWSNALAPLRDELGAAS